MGDEEEEGGKYDLSERSHGLACETQSRSSSQLPTLQNCWVPVSPPSDWGGIYSVLRALGCYLSCRVVLLPGHNL